jgi:hypothetical protein
MKFGSFQNLKEKLLGRPVEGPMVLPLAAYGKLGIYKDYINLECNDGPAAAFKAWMDAGFGLTFEEFGGRSVVIEGPKRLLWSLPDHRAMAVAVLWPSADEGGLRRFPFSFFTVLPRSTLAYLDFGAGWAALESIWIELESMFESTRELNNIEEFYEKFNEGRLQIAPVRPEPPPMPELKGWLASLDEDRDGSAADWLTRSLSDLIVGCRELPEEGAMLAVRLPLGGGSSLVEQTHFWLQVFSRNLKKCDAWPSMILPAGASTKAGGSLCLIWREPRTEDARLFAADSRDYDFAEDLTSTTRRASTPESPVESPEPAADEENQDLEVWIGRLGGAGG